MSGAGETNVDGKAHKEGDEVRRISKDLMFVSVYCFLNFTNMGSKGTIRLEKSTVMVPTSKSPL